MVQRAGVYKNTRRVMPLKPRPLCVLKMFNAPLPHVRTKVHRANEIWPRIDRTIDTPLAGLMTAVTANKNFERVLQDSRGLGCTGSQLVLRLAFVSIVSVFMANSSQTEARNWHDCLTFINGTHRDGKSKDVGINKDQVAMQLWLTRMGGFKLALTFGRRGYESRYSRQAIQLLGALLLGDTDNSAVDIMIEWSMSWDSKGNVAEMLNRVLMEGNKDTAVMLRKLYQKHSTDTLSHTRVTPVTNTMTIVERLFNGNSEEFRHFILHSNGSEDGVIACMVEGLFLTCEHIQAVLKYSEHADRRKTAERLIKRTINAFGAISAFVEGATKDTLEHMQRFPKLLQAVWPAQQHIQFLRLA